MTSTNTKVVVEGYYDLLALHKALLEAKFCDVPNNFDVSASPLVAGLANRTVDALIAAESERKGSDVTAAWKAWRLITPDRREWGVAVGRASAERRWRAWSDAERSSFVVDLLAPFTLSDGLMAKFAADVEGDIRASQT